MEARNKAELLVASVSLALGNDETEKRREGDPFREEKQEPYHGLERIISSLRKREHVRTIGAPSCPPCYL